VDGTLVDSQGDILAAMGRAFASQNLPPPEREEVLRIVGLSLPRAFEQLAPQLGVVRRTHLLEAYKTAYAALVREGGPEASPLYPGMRDLLDRLSGIDHVLLGVATGKSRKGLTALLKSHGLTRHFVTRQVADDHPSKPHPAMLFAALDEAGLEAEQAVMIGDTSYDMEMASAAGIAGIGVTWGYHQAEALSEAAAVVQDAVALERAIEDILGGLT
jgi:phosphoglycolate phosphatase